MKWKLTACRVCWLVRDTWSPDRNPIPNGVPAAWYLRSSRGAATSGSWILPCWFVCWRHPSARSPSPEQMEGRSPVERERVSGDRYNMRGEASIPCQWPLQIGSWYHGLYHRQTSVLIPATANASARPQIMQSYHQLPHENLKRKAYRLILMAQRGVGSFNRIYKQITEVEVWHQGVMSMFQL